MYRSTLPFSQCCLSCLFALALSRAALGQQAKVLPVTHSGSSGTGSLAEAMARANVSDQPVVIAFRIPASDPGRDRGSRTCTIWIDQPLPPVTHGGVMIDGLVGNAMPGIVLRASRDGVDHALCLASPGNHIRGVAIGGFKHGLVVYGPRATGNTVRHCYFGLHPDGTAVPNGSGAIVVNGASGNTFDSCVVSGNRSVGLYLGDRGTSGNAITGCRIGTDPAGSARIPNRIGVMMARSEGNTVGPNTVVSGNDDIGILMSGKGSTGNAVRECLIGVDGTGTRPVHNNIGIVARSLANRNTFGPGNVISGNVQIGIYIEAAHDNRVIGNLIGTDITGTRIPRDGDVVQGNGVEFNTVAQRNIIGGSTPGDRNIISGHKVYGVVYYGHCRENTTQGNFVGTDRTGTKALPNATGICVDCASHHNDMFGNVISGNMSYGLFYVTRGSEYNVLRGNRIGTTADGLSPLPNDIGMVVSTGASHNVIGGPRPEHGNVFSGNVQAGIMITNRYTEDNLFEGNLVGLDAEGRRPVPNGSGIILSTYPTANTLRGNRVSGNTGAGIVLTEYAVGNVLEGNIVKDNGQADVLDLIPPGTPAPARAPEVVPQETPDPVPAIAPGPLPVDGMQVVTVTSTRSAGPGSLRAALTRSMATEGPCAIGFDIPKDDPGFDADLGVWCIRFEEALPPIAASDLLIDGATQTWAHGDTNPFGPEIVLDGNENTVETGLAVFDAARVTIHSLCIQRFVYGIQVFGQQARENRVLGCCVGIGPRGVEAQGNYNGIEIISGAAANVVGGLDATNRNVISGNQHMGIRISDASGNSILGNYVGLDASGSVAIPNYDGICVEGQAADNRIGGAVDGARNVLSGNVAYGVDLFGWGVTRNTVLGNFIGTDRTGRVAVPNTYGVLFDDRSYHNRVGGTKPGEWNLISGNTAFGAYLYNNGTRSNAIIGNRIGTDISGTSSLPNETGVHIDGGTFDNVVDSNLISGNLVAGITLFSIQTDRNVITRNRIGTDIQGTAALANGEDGIRIVLGARENRIGGTPEEGNVIAHNGRTGVRMESVGTARNTVAGNRMHDNGKAGIELGSGPPNGGIQPPAITSAEGGAAGSAIAGTARSAGRVGDTVEVFEAAPGEVPQGRTPLGRAQVGADGRWSLTVESRGVGARFTATATDRQGNTSRFSPIITAEGHAGGAASRIGLRTFTLDRDSSPLPPHSTGRNSACAARPWPPPRWRLTVS